ncbi:MAG: hypothetical protein O2960_29055 [Verrucomicrobia bacterium]|nr:hypothetical protein [Verrucomicrobiota bacterium]
MIDRVFFVLLLVCLPAALRRNTTLGLYTVFLGIIPATSTLLISYSRNIMMCFPIFIAMARFLAGSERKEVFWYVVALLGSLQVCFLIRYLNFYWAG